MSSTSSSSGGWNYVTVRMRLSHERLEPYLVASDRDLARAFALYEWNIAAAGAVLSTLAMAEVVIRNAMDEQLRRWALQRHAGRSWLDVATLDEQGHRDVAKARRYAQRGLTRGTEVPHGKVVAELNLGFWRYLAASRYLTELWSPALYGAFPGGPTDRRKRREEVEDHLNRLLLVRNRAAHHEPIFRRNLLRDLWSAAEVTGWICRDSAAWIRAKSAVRAVDAARPSLSG